MNRILKVALIAWLAVLLAGCGAPALPSGPTAQPWVYAQPTLTPLSPGQPDAAPPAEATTAPVPPAQGDSSAPLPSGGWQVTLYTANEVEVSTQPFVLQGSAPAGTVISINEQILVVDSSGAFNVEIPLEEGPNLVEVIASNAAGEEVDYLLTITYNP